MILIINSFKCQIITCYMTDMGMPICFQEEVPVVNFGAGGIIRCRRCRTYVNPYVTFTDGGRKWRCNACSLLNDGKFTRIMLDSLF